MSYTIAIAVPPIPADDQEAWQALTGFIAEAGPPFPAFPELHDRLVAVYPCMSSLPDDQVDSAVWSDGPLLDNFGHRAAVLGLVGSRVEEALPFVISTATSMGFSVFDWQTGTISRAPSAEMPAATQPPSHRGVLRWFGRRQQKDGR